MKGVCRMSLVRINMKREQAINKRLRVRICTIPGNTMQTVRSWQRRQPVIPRPETCSAFCQRKCRPAYQRCRRAGNEGKVWPHEVAGCGQ